MLKNKPETDAMSHGELVLGDLPDALDVLALCGVVQGDAGSLCQWKRTLKPCKTAISLREMATKAKKKKVQEIMLSVVATGAAPQQNLESVGSLDSGRSGLREGKSNSTM